MTDETKTGPGRPPAWVDPEAMAEKIEGYFQFKGNTGTTPTQSGLAYFLGFASRQSLWDYGQKDTFAYVIKRARLQLEDFHEGRLGENGCTGSIFWLKCNAGYQEPVVEQQAAQKLEVTWVEPGISANDDPD